MWQRRPSNAIAIPWYGSVRGIVGLGSAARRHDNLHVCVRRFNREGSYDVYPIPMQERLPIIAVPLLPADGDIEVDLQAIFQKTYEAGPFQRAIDYRTDKIEPALTKMRLSNDSPNGHHKKSACC